MTRKKKILFSLLSIGTLIVLTYTLNNPTKLLSYGDNALRNSNHKVAFEKYKFASTLYPFNPEPHIKLSEVFREANDWEKAKKEILLAIDLSKDKEVLGQKLREIEDTLNQPTKLRAEIVYWEKIAEESPDYRDAWIQISIRYYQLYDLPKALNALNRAKEIDPNNETIKKLEAVYFETK